MSPRPRTASDADLLGGAARVINRLGPARFTLADVAREVGLAPATLVQRFGSKRGLMLALAETGSRTVGQCFAGFRAAHRSPLAALLASLLSICQHVETPEALANSLAFLQIDLTDPEFHRHALAHSKAMLAGIRALLAEAVKSRELIACDTVRLARALLVTLNGSMITWAVMREGLLEKWLRHDLEAVLAPYQVSPRRKRKSSKRQRGSS